ncbi:MAG: hypothetical protein IPJ65_23575 [Archangiaceae bacterium]|nr:hypothetical protein [Archangiaceae bacterium]
MNAQLKPLPVDLTELCIALESEGDGFDWYLDTETGDTVLVNAEYEPDEYGGLKVEEIEGNPQRFRRVPVVDERQAFRDMEAFALAQQDERLKESLLIALEAPRPMRRFRAVLGWLPPVQHQWHAFRHQALVARACAWLEQLGLQPE